MIGSLAFRPLRRAAIVIVALGATGGTSRADPIPPEWLQQQHDTCVESCAQGGTQISHCEQGCTCVVTEEQATLSRDEYAIMSNAAAASQAIPPDLKEKLLTISDRCRFDD